MFLRIAGRKTKMHRFPGEFGTKPDFSLPPVTSATFPFNSSSIYRISLFFNG
jgi:hypothetical protein